MGLALAARDSYLAEYSRRACELPASGQAWMQGLRSDAIARFEKMGFPGARNEDWKYTSLTPLLRVPFGRAVDGRADFDGTRLGSAVAELPSLDGAPLLVFVDGRLVPSCSRLDGASGLDGPVAPLRIGSLRAAFDACPELLRRHLGRHLDRGSSFSALNTAFVEDGYVVSVAAGAAVEAPIHLLFFSTATATPQMCHPRNLIVMESGSTATVLEHFAGEAGAVYCTNAVTEVVLGEDARLSHLRYQRETSEAFHIGRVEVCQQAGSSLASYVVTSGAKLSRTEVAVELAGEHAECRLYGLYSIGADQHADHHTVIDHAVAHTQSLELYKGILDGHARGVFTGRIVVREGAQRIAAEQANKNLLLSAGAVVETRPQLEIHADDVRCSHGAAIGQLDAEALFYLRQRGVGQRQARAMLTRGFGREALASLQPETLRDDLERAALAAIAAGDGAPRESELRDSEKGGLA